MAIVVEDGTGLTNAQSYTSVAEFKTYHDARGNDYSSYADAAIEYALVKATDYIDRRWGRAFKGYREFPDNPQKLSFPRVYVYDWDGRVIEGIPTKLKEATSEYAWRALSGDLWPDPTYSLGGILRRVREKVGPIETETEYSGDSPSASTLRAYPPADALLKELIHPLGYAVR